MFTEHKLTRMNEAYTLVREHLGRAAERMKDHYDMRVRPAVFTRGQWVWYHTPRRYVGRSAKWQRMYTGPFLITRVWGPVDVVLQQSPRSKPFVAHVDKLRPCNSEHPVSWLQEEQPMVCQPQTVALPILGFPVSVGAIDPEQELEGEDTTSGDSSTESSSSSASEKVSEDEAQKSESSVAVVEPAVVLVDSDEEDRRPKRIVRKPAKLRDYLCGRNLLYNVRSSVSSCTESECESTESTVGFRYY